jgi:uncharacterized RDD family membrane protein YckC
MSLSPEPAQTSEPVTSFPSFPQGGDDQVPETPAPVLPGQEDLLGPRIAAALIDLAVLLGLFIVVVLTIGEIGAEGGEFTFLLVGTDAVVYVILVLVYYFALEATIGQTVGKRLLGLRVLRSDGSRPSVLTIAIRTLLRIVDWLPLLYLTGFITMMVTGVRRQRLGDLAARTRVGRVPPARHRGITAAGLAVVLLLLMGLAVQQAAVSDGGTSTQGTTTGGTTTGGAKIYSDNGVSFEYPDSWQQITPQDDVSAGDSDQLWTTAVSTSEIDGVSVTAYRLKTPVTAQNLDAVTPEVVTLVQQLAEETGGVVQSGPEQLTVAGLPGLRFQVTATADGTAVQSTMVFAFADTTEYFFNCQYTPGEAEEIQRGCDQIIRTFTVT